MSDIHVGLLARLLGKVRSGASRPASQPFAPLRRPAMLIPESPVPLLTGAMDFCCNFHIGHVGVVLFEWRRHGNQYASASTGVVVARSRLPPPSSPHCPTPAHDVVTAIYGVYRMLVDITPITCFWREAKAAAVGIRYTPAQ